VKLTLLAVERDMPFIVDEGYVLLHWMSVTYDDVGKSNSGPVETLPGLNREGLYLDEEGRDLDPLLKIPCMGYSSWLAIRPVSGAQSKVYRIV
jgi:hypothetical protein